MAGMRAAVYYGPHDIRIEEVERPVASQGEILVRVNASGICGTDSSEFVAGPKLYPLTARHPMTGHVGPMIPGHEFSGWIEAIGEYVSTDLKVGELVVTGAALWCGICAQCRAGRTSICHWQASIGIHRNGALAEYVSVPSHILVRAEPLSPDVATLVQPMAVANHAVRRSRPQDNEDALVIGAGGIGSFLIYALSNFGARVLAVDLSAERLAIARKLGAEATLRGADTDALRRELTKRGVTPTLVFEATGSEAGFDAAIALVEPGGTVVTIGIAANRVNLDARRVTLKEIAIIGTNGLVADEDVPAAIKLLAIDQTLWSNVAPAAIPLERLVEDGLLPMAEGRAVRIKTLVDPAIKNPRTTVMLDSQKLSS
jgi:(R,R)-butanediol dehydrogenase/meso-butanediol dehydrogenase/diacetyl reductase